MRPPSVPVDEHGRLEALKRYGLPDSAAETSLDDLTKLARHICGTPIALISIVDATHQWFKASIGLEMEGTPREISFCGHALHYTTLMVVPDALLDERFADSPLVVGPPHIRFYAGAPLRTSEGFALGSLCVLDHVPRQLSDSQQEAMVTLARQAVAQLELRSLTVALGDNERRLKIITENARIGLVMLNEERRYVYANRTYSEILGIPPGPLLGRRVADVLPDVYASQIEPRLNQAFAGERIAYELKRQGASGDRYFAVRYEPTPIEGPIAKVVVVISEITEQKQATLAANRVVALVESSDDAIIGKDLNSIITHWNTGAERIFGYTAAEMVGTSILRLIPPERHPEEELIMSRIRRGEMLRHFETVRQTQSGRLIHVSVTASPIKDGQGTIIGVSKVARDITHRIRTEGRFRRLVDSNVQGVAFWNTQGEFTDANDAFLKIVGYTREDLTSGALRWNSITPDVYADLDRRALKEIRERGRCLPFEKEFRRKDGTLTPVLVSAAMFDDSPEEGFCFVVDLTERKRLEQQVLRSQRMESIGTLAGGIAHDLNNVLSPIVMALELLRDLARDESDMELIRTLEANATRGADLVRQVLSFARGVSGQRILVDAGRLLHEMVKVIQDTFPKNIDVHHSITPGLWPVTGDPTQLHQVLLNLCVNARDAMPSGGRLSMSAQNVILDETYSGMNLDARPGAYLLIKVVDTGSGIPPEIRDRIFEPFFTTKEVGKGTGLGLATTMAIVRSHGGFIHLYSELGRGTQFQVYLPADPTTQSTGTEASPDEPKLQPGRGELILVVDDEEPIRKVVASTLERFNYRVRTAANGAEAVGVYLAHPGQIALVLTDMAMPIMDGPTMARAIHAIDPTMPIIGSSGLHSSGTLSDEPGIIQRFVPKPYTAETLLRAIRDVLHRQNKDF